MTPAKIYPFSIPAGGSFPLLVIGDYCKILTSSGALTLTGDTFGTIGPILSGQGIEDSPFQRLVLTDNTGAVNNGTILIADNKFIDDRITGEVTVIDGGKNRALANSGLVNTVGINASVGNYSWVQLWNPAGSGKNCILEQFSITSDTSTGFYLKSHNVAATTLSFAPKSKFLNSAITSLTELRYQASAASPGVLFASANAPITTQFTIEPKIPYVIPPGIGFCIVSSLVNKDVSAIFEWYEENI